MSKKRLASAALLAAVCSTGPVHASVTAASGYLYAPLAVGEVTQSCVASAPGGTFVAVGPGFTGAAQRVVLVTESGAQRDVVTGLNSVADCAYDPASDTLYVTDNGLEAPGAVTGDTVFAVPSASTATSLAASGLELVPPGSIPTAASLALAPGGGVYVGDAAGGGLGRVLLVDAGGVSTVISGLDFTGGLTVANGDLFVAQSLATFESEISRYQTDGTFLSQVSGPTFTHGSYDLGVLVDGRLAVTGAFGGDVVAIDIAGGSAALVSGLTFASGIDVDSFTGRVSILSSTFIPTEEDKTIHRFVPVARLVPGRGSEKKECVAEYYGVELVPAKPGKQPRHAICVDGSSCDTDATADGACVFPLGVCLGVADDRLPDCPAAGVASLELRKAKPASASWSAMVAAAQAVLPAPAGTCFFSDGVIVPLKTTKKGKIKPGKAVIKVRAETDEGKPRKDTDKIKLMCLPATP